MAKVIKLGKTASIIVLGVIVVVIVGLIVYKTPPDTTDPNAGFFAKHKSRIIYSKLAIAFFFVMGLFAGWKQRMIAN
mgnify:CR=1 FL=1